MGVALGGVALDCSVPQLPNSAIYKAIWMKPTLFNHKFLIKYIFTNFKSTTPLFVGVALGGVALRVISGNTDLRCNHYATTHLTNLLHMSQILT